MAVGSSTGTGEAARAVRARNETAHATLQVVQALNFPPARCHLTTAHWLKVYPPNQTKPVYLNFTAKTCAARGKGVRVLNVAPVRPGAVDS